MDDQERRADLAARLAQAGAAHSEYEMTALHGEYDQQWAEWYARHLLDHGWNDLFPRAWLPADLSETLRHFDAEQRANAPHRNWYEYYAELFARNGV